jgi:hypothetical protein
MMTSFLPPTDCINSSRFIGAISSKFCAPEVLAGYFRQIFASCSFVLHVTSQSTHQFGLYVPEVRPNQNQSEPRYKPRPWAMGFTHYVLYLIIVESYKYFLDTGWARSPHDRQRTARSDRTGCMGRLQEN